MPHLSAPDIKDIIGDINNESEKSRRAMALRRHKIFRDGGKAFLTEELMREFDSTTLVEFRLCPVNVLKVLVLKKSTVYRQPATRKAVDDQGAVQDSDQALIDFYTDELSIDQQMQKANTYWNLQANAALYVFPKGDLITMAVTPPHLYSIVPNVIDNTEVDVWIFNQFIEEDEVTSPQAPRSATGRENWQRDNSAVGSPGSKANPVASRERVSGDKRTYIMWSDETHVTVNSEGNPIVLDPEKGDEQFLNPIGVSPVVHLQQETDNEPWASQGEDAVDLSLLIQKTWTDLMTIIKHQGFGQMVITSEEQPKKITIGVNKTLWLQRFAGKEPPTITFAQADSRISEIKESLQTLTFLLLSTNEVNTSALGRSDGASAFNSGIQAMLEMSSAVEASRASQPTFRDAEKSLWQIIAKWHNWMLEMGILRDDAKKLGKFSDDFSLSIAFVEPKPMQSTKEKLDVIEQASKLKLITRKDALKKLHPDMSEEEIENKLKEIDEESDEMRERFMSQLLPPPQDKAISGQA